MEWQGVSQTPEHVGPGKYLRRRDYAQAPSRVPFGSARPRCDWARPREVSAVRDHARRARRAAEEERQAEFEEEVGRALNLWLARYRLNLVDSVVFTLKVQNLDYAILAANQGLTLAFRERVEEGVASLAGGCLTQEHIHLELSPGSSIGLTIMVRCTVTPPRGVRANVVAACVLSATFAAALASGLAAVDGLEEASIASWPIRVAIVGTPRLEPVKFGCNVMMHGPDAPENCTECGSYHFWLCCCCGVAQYEKPCANGCDSGQFGWVCISSVCKDNTTTDNASVTCGCWRKARYNISK